MKSKLLTIALGAMALSSGYMTEYAGGGGNGGGHWRKSNMTPKQKKLRNKSKASRKARKKNR